MSAVPTCCFSVCKNVFENLVQLFFCCRTVREAAAVRPTCPRHHWYAMSSFLLYPVQQCFSSAGLAKAQALGAVSAKDLPSMKDLGCSPVLELASTLGADGVERIESYCDLFSVMMSTVRARLYPEILDPNTRLFLLAAPSYKHLRFDPRQSARNGRFLQVAELNVGGGRVVLRVPQPVEKAEQLEFRQAIVCALYKGWSDTHAGEVPPNWVASHRAGHFLNAPGVWSVTLGMMMRALEVAFDHRPWSMRFHISHLEFMSLGQKTMPLSELSRWYHLSHDIYFDVRHTAQCWYDDGGDAAGAKPAVIGVNGHSMPTFNAALFDHSEVYTYRPSTDGRNGGFQTTRYLHGWASCLDLASGGVTYKPARSDRGQDTDMSPQLAAAKIYNPVRADIQAELHPWSAQGYPTSRNGWYGFKKKMRSAVELLRASVENADTDARAKATVARLSSLAFEYSYYGVDPVIAWQQASELTR